MAITYHLGRRKDPSLSDLNAGSVRWLYVLQFGAFIVALGVTIAFGIDSTW